jgi:hypothetical protein
MKPLIDEKKDIPVSVYMGVQTDDSCADPVLVHMVDHTVMLAHL